MLASIPILNFIVNLFLGFKGGVIIRDFQRNAFQRNQEKQADWTPLDAYEQFLFLTNELPICAAVLTEDMLHQYANPSYCKWFGAECDQLYSTTLWKLFAPSSHQELQLCLTQCLSGTTVHEKKALRLSGGEERWVVLDLIPFSSSNRPGILWFSRDITKEMQRELELRRSNHQLSTTLACMPDGVIIGSAIRDADNSITDFCIEYVNPTVCLKTNKPKEELVGRTLTGLLPEMDQNLCIRLLQKLVETGEILNEEDFEYEDHFSGKAYRGIYDCHAAKLDDGFVFTWRDIKDRRRIEQALVKEHHSLSLEHNRLRAVLDAVPVGMLYTDAHGGILEANEGAELIWGGAIPVTHTIEDFSVFQAYWPNTQQRIPLMELPLIRSILSGEIYEAVEMDIETFDRECKTILMYSRPIYSDAQHIAGVVCAVVDITDRKHTLEALKESNQRIGTLLQSIMDGFLSVDRHWKFNYINKAGALMLQKSPEEMLGRTVWDVFPNAMESPYYKNFKNAVLEGTPLHFEIYNELIHSWYECRCYPSDKGGFSVFFNDTTQRKQMEVQLKELNATLEKRVRERTESLLRYQERLRALSSQLTLTEQQERQRLASELHDYLAQMLVLCRMKMDQILRSGDLEKRNRTTQEINTLLEESLKYTRNLIAQLSPRLLYESGLVPAIHWLADNMKQHGLLVQVHDQDLRPTLPEDRAVLIFQTIRELLFNIVKHAKVNDADVSLRQESPGELTIVISDLGAGFETGKPLEQISGKEHYGLFSIRERIEALGGWMMIESSPGRGTTVLFSVPIQVEEGKIASPLSNPSQEFLSAESSDHSQLDRSKVQILLADDHDMVRLGLRSIIESCGNLHIAAEAKNGEEAVQLTLAFQPDAVVMDVNMPVVSGIEATRRIKEKMPRIVIIALSAQKDLETEKIMKEAGVSHYFTKGESSDELCRVLQNLMSQKGGE